MRRDGDGAVMIDVEGSPCVLIALTDEDDDVRVFANARDAALARGGWQDASGDIPGIYVRAARRYMATPGWCDVDE
jgi:hypothetical protein